jgi:hypothetical protein
MSNMQSLTFNNQKSYKLYIKKFDFAEPDFSWLPKDIGYIDRLKLTKMETQILDSIIYQRNISNSLLIQPYSTLNSFYRLSISGVMLGVVGFFLLSLTYYANVNLKLGMNFLTELFA